MLKTPDALKIHCAKKIIIDKKIVNVLAVFGNMPKEEEKRIMEPEEIINRKQQQKKT